MKTMGLGSAPMNEVSASAIRKNECVLGKVEGEKIISMVRYAKTVLDRASTEDKSGLDRGQKK